MYREDSRTVGRRARAGKVSDAFQTVQDVENGGKMAPSSCQWSLFSILSVVYISSGGAVGGLIALSSTVLVEKTERKRLYK